MGTLSVFAETLAESQAKFGEVSGTVEVLGLGSAQWVDAHIDLPLEVGDQIRVGEDGSAELSITQNVMWKLDSLTEVVVGHTTTQEGHLTLLRGVLLGKVESANGISGNWEFETPLGVCAVRGTEFALVHSDQEGTHLGVFKGSVQLSPAESATESFSPEAIDARQEGVLQKRKPIKKLAAFSPTIQAQAERMTAFRKRYTQVANVWVPLTPDYRKELRQKYIAPVKPHPVHRPSSTPARRSKGH